MAQYDITSEAQLIISLGGETKLRQIPGVEQMRGIAGTDWVAWNRRAESAVYELMATVERAALPEQATAKQIAFIARLGGTAPADLTKAGASKLIDQLKDPRTEADRIGQSYGTGQIWDNA
jgi:hypothetical protein